MQSIARRTISCPIGFRVGLGILCASAALGLSSKFAPARFKMFFLEHLPESNAELLDQLRGESAGDVRAVGDVATRPYLSRVAQHRAWSAVPKWRQPCGRSTGATMRRTPRWGRAAGTALRHAPCPTLLSARAAAACRQLAYVDAPLPIGHNATISAPHM